MDCTCVHDVAVGAGEPPSHARSWALRQVGLDIAPAVR